MIGVILLPGSQRQHSGQKAKGLYLLDAEGKETKRTK